MKRTPLKRKTWLERGRQALRRTPLRRVGARRKRGANRRRAWRKEVFERAGGRCERCGDPARDPHHLWPVGRGGPDEPWNSASLCRKCHSTIHSHSAPDWSAWTARDKEGAKKIRERLDGELGLDDTRGAQDGTR